MDKESFHRYNGRDLAVRAVSYNQAESAAEKTASFSEDELHHIEDQLNGTEYVDTLNKVAEARGAAQAFGAVLEHLNETGGNVEKVANAVSDAYEKTAFIALEPVEESEEYVEEKIAGCAEALGAMYGEDPANDEVIKVAANIVADSFEG